MHIIKNNSTSVTLSNFFGGKVENLMDTYSYRKLLTLCRCVMMYNQGRILATYYYRIHWVKYF